MSEKNKESQKQRDAEHLAKFGYKQELLREMGGFSNFAISFSIISILTGLISMFGYGVNLVGGAVYWTWVVVAFFQLFNAMSMGEIASRFPLAGGIYQWARHLGNPHLGWWVGWINLIAWWAVTVAIDFSLGTLLAGSGWFGLQMDTTTIVSLTIAIMTIHMIMNIYGIKLVLWFNDFSVWVHMFGTIMLLTLLLLWGKAHPISYIFSTDTPAGDVGTLSSPGFWVAFLPAILMSAWTLTAFDASADVSEETEDPQHHVPWGMVIAVVASFIFGSFVLFGLILALPAMDQIPKIMETTSLATYIIQNVMGSTWGVIMLAIIAMAQFACGLSSMTVYQRVIFSLARDGNLPFSNQLKKVNKKGAPYVATVVGTLCMAVLTIWASVLATITSIATLGFYFGYFIVIIIAVRARLNGSWTDLGPWNLGKHGIWIAVVAILWNLYISISVVLPPNFITFKIFGAIMVVLAIYYFGFMRKKLQGLNQTLSSDELEKMERAAKLATSSKE
jgi:amino acid transporter